MSWGLALARVLAWALLLGGWIGVAAFADRFSAGPVGAGLIVAAWLLATGAVSAGLARVRWSAALGWLALPGSALLASVCLAAAVQGGGRGAVLGFALAWAALLALASHGVRAWRLASTGPARPASPIGSATAGALLAWAVVGDPSDLPALADRLAALAGMAALLLATWRPVRRAPGDRRVRPGCRAGLFDCSLPSWPSGAWRDPAHWPPALAALVMLPMMCGLPQMLARCRSDMLSASAVLGLHLVAMFLPALLWFGLTRAAAHTARSAQPMVGRPAGRWRSSLAWRVRLAPSCAWLLVLGGAAAVAGGPWAAWGIALAHGAAWSLAWAARLEPAAASGVSRSPTARRASVVSMACMASKANVAGSAWQAGLRSALLVLLLAALQSQAGGLAMDWVHGLLGLLAGLALVLGGLQRAARVLLAGPPGAA